MKKRFALLLALCLALFLCACASITNTMHYVQRNGVDYEVDTQAQTISDGTNTYNYTFSESGASYSITVSYPNRSTYTLSGSTYGSHSSHSSNYSSQQYTDGEILCDILEDIHLNERASGIQLSGKKFFLVLFLGAAGIFLLLSPHTAWYLSHGWHYKDAEPSEASLTWNRISGAICIALAVLAILMPI